MPSARCGRQENNHQFDENHRLLNEHQRDIIPSAAINLFGLDVSVRKDMFFHMCRDGLFSYVDEVAKKATE